MYRVLGSLSSPVRERGVALTTASGLRSVALTLRWDLWARGVKRRRLLERFLRPPQHRSKDVADAVAIVLAEVAGLDARKQRHRLSSAQVEAEKVFEQFEPLQHWGGHRRPEQAHLD